MSKYKVCVYAISKNEEQFVKRWVKSMSEADSIYVLDTGSTDNTVKLFKELNVNVKQEIINPFRFDVARNKSLEMIKEDFDIYVCTDLDEVFNIGWRKALEEVWQKDTNRLRYIYNWSLDSNNVPKVTFYGEKFHDGKHYKWVNPVHEILKFNGFYEHVLTTDDIVLNHYPDNNKSRSSYLPLLELAVKEDPTNDRNMHYLGREYMYYKRYNESIDTLIKHLKLKSATWKDERCASMRFIARCYAKLKRYDEAILWANKAITEAPYLRDSFMEKALICYTLKDFKEVEKCCLKALKIKKKERTYINEVFSWDNTIYDLLSIAYFDEGKYQKSLECVKKALKMAPLDERLKNNLKLIKEKIKETKKPN